MVIDLDSTVLALGSFAFVVLLFVWHRAKDNTFDLKSLFSDESGKLSLAKFGQFIALVASTWVLVHQTRIGALTEWLLMAYLVTWSGANAVSKYLDSKQK